MFQNGLLKLLCFKVAVKGTILMIIIILSFVPFYRSLVFLESPFLYCRKVQFNKLKDFANSVLSTYIYVSNFENFVSKSCILTIFANNLVPPQGIKSLVMIKETVTTK